MRDKYSYTPESYEYHQLVMVIRELDKSAYYDIIDKTDKKKWYTFKELCDIYMVLKGESWVD